MLEIMLLRRACTKLGEMVQEKGHGTTVAADGEIPYKLTPGEQFGYADLAGKHNAFATIDYSMDPPWVFLGNSVTLEEIGLLMTGGKEQ